MALFRDLIQQNQIQKHAQQASSLDYRVLKLEESISETRQLLQVLLERLETHLGEDIDEDGKIG